VWLNFAVLNIIRLYIFTFMQDAFIGDISYIPGGFSFENFWWFNLKSDKGVVVTKVIFDLGHLTGYL